MTRRVYSDGRLVEEWDDPARIHRAWDEAGKLTERGYTAAEYRTLVPLPQPARRFPLSPPLTEYPASGAPGATVLSACPSDLFIPTDPAARRVVLSASLPWEAGSVQEPAVWFHNGAWHMYYTGGWNSAAIGYATAPNPQGPWTKTRGPVLGAGAAGVAAPTAHHSVYVEAGTIHLLYPSAIDGGNLMVATAAAAAPTVLTPRGIAMSAGGPVVGITNTDVFKRGEGDYVLMFDGRGTSGPVWQTGVATGTSPLGPFTLGRFSLPTLSRGDGTAIYGGPQLRRQGSTWVLFYHASTTSTLPTDIYRATSTDLVNWTQDPKVFVRRTLPVEVDQSADLCMAANPDGGPSYAFWDGMDNPNARGSILMGVPRAVIAQFDGSQWTPIS
jgi:hypothetical protein